MIDRADRSGFSAWWFTVDRTAFFLVLALIAIGMMLAFAASPAITGGPLTAGDFRYAARQLTFTTLAGVILAGSFAALTLAGNSTLSQMGFAISFGIAMAAFVMAMFFTPALTAVIGHSTWWPGHSDRARAREADAGERAGGERHDGEESDELTTTRR